MSRREKPKVASVDLQEVGRLAELSRLLLTPHEAERLRGELSSILDYFATLDKVDVPEAAAPGSDSQGGELRQDVVAPSTPEELLRGVPQRKGRHVRAPRVF